jgi:transposase
VAENEGEVCLEEEVERLRRSGMSGVEISRTLGVEQAWVEALLSDWGEGTSAEGDPAGARG